MTYMATIINPSAPCDRITWAAYSATSLVRHQASRLIQGVQALQRRIYTSPFVETVRQTSFSYFETARSIVQTDAANACTIVHDLSTFVKSLDDFDTFLRFTHEGITFADLARHSEKVSRPVLTYFGAAIGFINIGRFINSISGLVSGKMVREYGEKKYLEVAISVSFLFTRTYSTVTWLVQQNLVSAAFLLRPLNALSGTKVVQVLAQNRAFQYAVPLFTRIPVISLLYLIAFSALAIKNLDEIREGTRGGKNVSHNVLEYKSMVAYVALVAIGLTPFGTPLVCAALATIAAGTGMAACFVKMANSRTTTIA